MMQLSEHSGVIPLPQAINKYFELSLYLLVLTGFGTLASTGGLDLPTILLVGVALAFRGYLLAERRRVVISERWTTPLTIVYFVFYAADYFLLSRAFLAATVHLVMFAVVVRTFSLRRDRDYTTLAILAFLMVLASAVLTVDSVFLLFFAGFMLMAVATFILMEMRRSGRAAKFQARHSRDAHEHRHLAFSLARVTPGLVLMILVGAAAVFFLLPRMSAGYLGGYSFGTDLSTGFSDRVQLGRIGQIQQSNAVVMHIQINGDQAWAVCAPLARRGAGKFRWQELVEPAPALRIAPGTGRSVFPTDLQPGSGSGLRGAASGCAGNSSSPHSLPCVAGANWYECLFSCSLGTPGDRGISCAGG